MCGAQDHFNDFEDSRKQPTSRLNTRRGSISSFIEEERYSALCPSQVAHFPLTGLWVTSRVPLLLMWLLRCLPYLLYLGRWKSCSIGIAAGQHGGGTPPIKVVNSTQSIWPRARGHPVCAELFINWIAYCGIRMCLEMRSSKWSGFRYHPRLHCRRAQQQQQRRRLQNSHGS